MTLLHEGLKKAILNENYKYKSAKKYRVKKSIEKGFNDIEYILEYSDEEIDELVYFRIIKLLGLLKKKNPILRDIINI